MHFQQYLSYTARPLSDAIAILSLIVLYDFTVEKNHPKIVHMKPQDSLT